MASLTIDQLKKSLTEQGIALPPSGSKKADYVRLYEQYSTLNENLGDFYSSDDENPPKNNSQSVSSSSSPSKLESIMKEVERLTDDELYGQLKELGASIGPVLKNTRKVYEKKLVKLLGGGGGGQTNGMDASIARKSGNSFRVEEFSDSEVDLPSVKTTYRKMEYREPFSGRKSSVNRDSPKPNVEESGPDPVLERKYSTHTFSETDKKSPTFGTFTTANKTSKFSFIETIPKGSTYRYIEPTSEVDYPSNTFRSRFNTEKSSYGHDEIYTSSWEPNIKKYMAPQQQSKILRRGTATGSQNKTSSYRENILAVFIVLAFILLVLYFYFYHWSPSDPYKDIEDDAERELEHLAAKSVD